MVSMLPWGLDGNTTYTVAHKWTIIDDWRVAELAFEESRKLVVDTNVATTEAIMADYQRKSQRYGHLTEMVKQLDRITIYNDMQLWLAFKFLHKNGHEARIEVASEVETRHAQHLRALSAEFFRKDLPYVPNPDPERRFSDDYLTFNVADTYWSRYYYD